jgi:hypothetical protein
MSGKFSLILISLLLLFLVKADTVSADGLVVSSSASLITPTKGDVYDFDLRIFKLQMYLKKHNSPLELYADHIVRTADKYGLDWRLVTAIAGVESTFGKRIPKGSFNAYGWVNGDYKFKSWEDSIETVSRSLKEKYINRGADSIEKIAKIYAPPSRTWSGNVKFFIYKIDSSPVEFGL